MRVYFSWWKLREASEGVVKQGTLADYVLTLIVLPIIILYLIWKLLSVVNFAWK